jgi:predicted RNA-binding Zn ribbon-like protein
MADIELLLSFLNSRAAEPAPIDYFATATSFVAWMSANAGVEIQQSAAEEQAREARRLRAAILGFLSDREAPDERTIAALNRVSASAPLRVRVDSRGGIALDTTVANTAGFLSRIVAILYDAALEGSLERLKACADADCAYAYFDSSKNHSRVWCDMGTCGSRNKVRAFRERKRAATTSGTGP